MPRRNRVTPFGEIVATPERGLLMGNRGVLCDASGAIVRAWQVRRWIACRTDFRGRWRPAVTPGRWTALYFLDEATALAAGHRPCGECRYDDHRRFTAAFGAAHGVAERRVDAVDRILHLDRLDDRRDKRTYVATVAELPDGAMVEVDGTASLVRAGALWRWTPGGYGAPREAPGGELVVLTPRSVVAAIAAGYAPALHPSAGG